MTDYQGSALCPDRGAQGCNLILSSWIPLQASIMFLSLGASQALQSCGSPGELLSVAKYTSEGGGGHSHRLTDSCESYQLRPQSTEWYIYICTYMYIYHIMRHVYVKIFLFVKLALLYASSYTIFLRHMSGVILGHLTDRARPVGNRWR